MAKYGPKTKKTVGKEMHKFKEGTLRSGSGKKVTNPRQAVAIGLSEARREGDKVPSRASSRGRRKPAKSSSRSKKR